MVRIVPDLDKLPPGIAEVTARPDGFRLRFTKPVNAERARNPAHYTIASYRRISTPAYGGDDMDRRTESPVSARPARDGMSVDLVLDQLRAGFVYAFRVRPLTDDDDAFYPAEAFYTLRRIPR